MGACVERDEGVKRRCVSRVGVARGAYAHSSTHPRRVTPKDQSFSLFFFGVESLSGVAYGYRVRLVGSNILPVRKTIPYFLQGSRFAEPNPVAPQTRAST